MSSPTSSSQLEELRTDLICSGLYLLEVSLGGCVVGMLAVQQCMRIGTRMWCMTCVCISLKAFSSWQSPCLWQFQLLSVFSTCFHTGFPICRVSLLFSPTTVNWEWRGGKRATVCLIIIGLGSHQDCFFIHFLEFQSTIFKYNFSKEFIIIFFPLKSWII